MISVNRIAWVKPSMLGTCDPPNIPTISGDRGGQGECECGHCIWGEFEELPGARCVVGTKALATGLAQRRARPARGRRANAPKGWR